MSIKGSYLKIESFENFQKMSFRNRCIIFGSNGLQNLSIPLLHGREQRLKITDVRMDDSSAWRKHHWKALVSCYNKAPFFENYAADVKRLIFNEQQNLFLFNMEIIRWIFETLEAKVNISFTSEYVSTPDGTLIIDKRNYLLPATYDKIRDPLPKYMQVFEDRLGFKRNLSILDLLFCEGPNSKVLLAT